MKFRVLQINDTLKSFGGAESYMVSLDQLLKERGYETKMLGGKAGVGLRDSFFSRWYSADYYRKTKSAIENFKPNLIHIHNISRVVSPSILLASKKYKLPIIQSVHDYHYICPKLWMITDDNLEIRKHDSLSECLNHHLPKNNFFYSLLQSTKSSLHKQLVKKYVDHFICPSKELAEWYSDEFSKENVSCIPNFVDLPSYISSKLSKKQILFVGRLSKEKGVELLIRAFQKISKDLPDYSLVIIGDGPEKSSLKKLTLTLNINNKIIFIDAIPKRDLLKYYLSSSLLVVPSIWIENCPLVALEAIMSSCPIVASNAGGLKDLIINNSTGLFFKRGDQEDLSNTLLRLLQDDELLKKFRKNQRNHSNQFTKKKHFERIEQVYQKFLI